MQIIVTNCMILGRAEAFASKQPVGRALLDALGTAVGFALALLVLGTLREAAGPWHSVRRRQPLFGPVGRDWQLTRARRSGRHLPIAVLPPGPF